MMDFHTVSSFSDKRELSPSSVHFQLGVNEDGDCFTSFPEH